MRSVSAELYPFGRNGFERNGLCQNYIDEGTGDPVLMVHGNPTWSFYYRELVKRLSGQFRCVVPDHIGCGYSDKPSDDDYNYTLESRVDDLEALVEYLDLRDVRLVVHDWGGMIGMAWAVRNPDRVKQIVVLNTGAFHNPKGLKLPPPLWLVRNTPLGSLLVRGMNGFARGATLTCTTRTKLSAEVINGYVAPYDSWKDRIATLRFVEDIPLNPGDQAYDCVTRTAEGLSDLTEIPMMICWGMKDFVFDEAFLVEWERRFPNASVHRFDDCGHYVLEDAQEEIGELVQEFFGGA